MRALKSLLVSFGLLLALAANAVAQELPAAKPADVGLSAERLDRITQWLQADVDKGTIPGAVLMIVRNGKVAYFEVRRRARSRDQGADEQGCDLPHLFDDQADHLGRRHDARRAGQALDRRADLEIHPGVQGHEGRRRGEGRGRQAEARSRRRQADHHPGPAAPHLRHHLRLLRRHGW